MQPTALPSGPRPGFAADVAVAPFTIDRDSAGVLRAVADTCFERLVRGLRTKLDVESGDEMRSYPLLEVRMAHINDCVPGRQARIRQTGVGRVTGKTGTIVEVSRIRRPPTGALQDRVTVDIPAHGEIVVTPDDVEVLPN